LFSLAFCSSVACVLVAVKRRQTCCYSLLHVSVFLVSGERFVDILDGKACPKKEKEEESTQRNSAAHGKHTKEKVLLQHNSAYFFIRRLTEKKSCRGSLIITEKKKEDKSALKTRFVSSSFDPNRLSHCCYCYLIVRRTPATLSHTRTQAQPHTDCSV
jgi:hypothetical protein